MLVFFDKISREQDNVGDGDESHETNENQYFMALTLKIKGKIQKQIKSYEVKQTRLKKQINKRKYS